ncbi:MAG: hypothetical protein DRN04_11965, partial [Thermoprotei archaeon]
MVTELEVLKVVEKDLVEKDVQRAFDENLEAIEEGLRFVWSQVNIGVGVIDTLAVDRNNVPVIIEYKVDKADIYSLVQVLKYYS